MMKRESFQQAVDLFKHRKPFHPFVIELDSGERLVVGEPKALHCYAGAATYVRPDGEFIFVDSEDVKQLLELTAAPS
jgi:hypothetical protein